MKNSCSDTKPTENSAHCDDLRFSRLKIDNAINIPLNDDEKNDLLKKSQELGSILLKNEARSGHLSVSGSVNKTNSPAGGSSSGSITITYTLDFN